MPVKEKQYILTEEDVYTQIADDLSPIVQKVGDIQIAPKNLWEEKPVSFEEFVNSRIYLNQEWNGKRGCRPKILKIGIEVVKEHVREAVLLLGKGCIAGSTLITLADGSTERIDKLYKRYGGKKTIRIFNVYEKTNLPTISKAAVKYFGKKELYRIQTDDGRILELTSNHRLVTWFGKKQLKDLCVGDSIAVCRDQRIIEGKDTVTPEEARFLGYMCGDGYTSNSLLRFCFTNGNRSVLEDFTRCIKTIDPNVKLCIQDKYAPNKWMVWFGKRTAPNATALILKSGLYGRTSKTKQIPKLIQRATKQLMGEFLVGYWMTDGECNIKNSGNKPKRIYFEISSISKDLIYGTRDLLLRLGISVKVHKTKKDIKTDGKIYKDYIGYHLGFVDDLSQKRFFRYVKLISFKGENQIRGLEEAKDKTWTTADNSFVPEDITSHIRTDLKCDFRSHDIRRLTGNGKKMNVQLLDVVSENILIDHRRYANGAVQYVGIKSIEKLDGLQDVYDLTIDTDSDSLRNYCANGFISSNSGKDYISSILHLYGVYKCLCMKRPQDYYGLARSSSIYFINVARNEAQARNVFFAEFKGLLQNSPWFAGRYSETAQLMRFSKRITALSGNSMSFSWLGYNVLQWVGDEIAFFLEKQDDEDSQSKAEESWEAGFGSCMSRFPNDYKMVGITTPRYDDDFVMHKYHELKERPDGFAIRAATWEIAPHLTIESFVHHFKRNYRRTMRDFGAIPAGVVESFWANPNIVEENVCETCRMCPVYRSRRPDMPYEDVLRCNNYEGCKANGWDGYGFRNWFKPDPNAEYYIHMDLSKNKDYLGIALTHLVDTVQIKRLKFDVNEDDEEEDRVEYDEKPVIKVDCIIMADPKRERNDLVKKGEIYYTGIRKTVIYELRRLGFNIIKITADSYQSHDMKQKLEDQDFIFDLLSMDREDVPAVNAKEAINENRVIYPFQGVLCHEAKYLKYVRGTKVDHVSKLSKDCWDAVAGAVYNVIEDFDAGGIFSELTELVYEE